MNRPPFIVAVTVNFGRPDDTFECVASLLATQYPHLRIVVVDNGSAPDVRERLRQELPSGVVFIRSEKNLGFSGGNNLGIRHGLDAGADYIVLINNDATLKPDALRIVAESAPMVRGLGILGGKILVAEPDEAGQRQIWSAGGWYSQLKASGYLAGQGEVDQGQFDHASDTEFIPGCLWVVPSDVFRMVGLLEEDYFLYTEDLDYALRLHRARYRLYYEPRIVCYHKVSRSHWQDRGRASPLLNYYTNRNRVHFARRWLTPIQRAVFYVYFVASRLVAAAVYRDRSYLAGMWDGLRWKVGPR